MQPDTSAVCCMSEKAGAKRVQSHPCCFNQSVFVYELLGSCTNVCFAMYLPVNKISQEICKIITTGRTCTVRLIKLSTVINCFFQKIMCISKREESEPGWKTKKTEYVVLSWLRVT